MRHSSMLGFGGAAAQAVGILYVLVGATHFLLPRAQLRGAGGVAQDFFQSLSRSSLVFSMHYWIVAVLSLLTIAVYLALLSLLRKHLGGPLCWAAAVGLAGAAFCAVDFAYVGVEAPRIARAYAEASPAVQALLVALGIPHLDPCFLAWGLMGVFAVAANAAVLRHGLLPRVLGGMGVLGGIVFLLVFAGALLRSPRTIDVAVGLGGFVIGPIWYCWAGLALRRAGRLAAADVTAATAPPITAERRFR